jgi:ABC-type transport system substrate-binding protein
MFAISDGWQRVGVGVQAMVDPPQRARDREYEATRPGFYLTRNDNIVHSLIRFQSSQTPLPENNFVGQNRNRYMNPEFDALLDRYFTTIPMQERIGVLGQIVHHMTDMVTNLDLFYDVEGALVTRRLQNVTFSRAQNAHEWDLQP